MIAMSRIGKQPIPVPDGVTVAIEPMEVSVKGPKGELAERKAREIEVSEDDGQIVVSRPTDRGEHRALHGLTRSLIANMVEGVTSGFEKRLEIQGVGYRAQLRGKAIELSRGLLAHRDHRGARGHRVRGARAHPDRGPRHLQAAGGRDRPRGSASVRPPEPYKGKGIRYQGEYVARKVGKRA